MTPHTPSAWLTSKLSFVCQSCSRKLWRQKPSFPVRQRRYISQNFIRKTEEAKEAWAEQAKEIKAGQQESMLKKLEDRGYINSVVG